MKFILIWIVMSSGGVPATGSEVFANKASCEYAAKWFELVLENRSGGVNCVPYDLVEFLK